LGRVAEDRLGLLGFAVAVAVIIEVRTEVVCLKRYRVLDGVR